jgi:hypothetical protein
MLLQGTNRKVRVYKELEDCESAYNLIVDPETAPFDIAFFRH